MRKHFTYSRPCVVLIHCMYYIMFKLGYAYLCTITIIKEKENLARLPRLLSNTTLYSTPMVLPLSMVSAGIHELGFRLSLPIPPTLVASYY